MATATFRGMLDYFVHLNMSSAMSLMCRSACRTAFRPRLGSHRKVVQRRTLYRGDSAYLSHRPYRVPGMTVESFPACFVRGGTSNRLLIHRRDLPKRTEEWQPILASAMGSPDQYGRQLDGMGSGVSSTSKVCIVEKSSRPGADLDYTFVQVGIKDGSLDMAGNCGNMSSAVAPFGLSDGLLHNIYVTREGDESDRDVNVRFFNTNTNKLIVSSFNVPKDGVYDPFGDYSIDGVPGTGSRITMSFRDPAGSKTGKALPTGNPIDTLELPDGTSIEASLTDVANPGVFVRAADIGIPGDIKPAALEEQADIMIRLEQIRRAGAKMIGLDPDIQSIPKIIIVSAPDEAAQDESTHIICRARSMQQPHKAVPLTLALNLGASVRMPGTIPAMTAVNTDGLQSVTIAHASGRLEVGSVLEDGNIKSALLHRTARILMKGDVFYTAKSEEL
ncbi:putative isomerase [Fulvia fulva]|nr:putative isomerase [Fulvia fulva]